MHRLAPCRIIALVATAITVLLPAIAGASWTNPGLFVDPHYVRDSDPALTVNSDGDFFAMLLAYTGDTGEPNGILMYRSTDGGSRTVVSMRISPNPAGTYLATLRTAQGHESRRVTLAR